MERRCIQEILGRKGEGGFQSATTSMHFKTLDSEGVWSEGEA